MNPQVSHFGWAYLDDPSGLGWAWLSSSGLRWWVSVLMIVASAMPGMPGLLPLWSPVSQQAGQAANAAVISELQEQPEGAPVQDVLQV